MSEGFLLPYILLLALGAAYLIAYGVHCIGRERRMAAVGSFLLAAPALSLCAIFVFILLRSFY